MADWTQWHFDAGGLDPRCDVLIGGGTRGNADPPVDRCLACAFEEFRVNPPGSVRSIVTDHGLFGRSRATQMAALVLGHRLEGPSARIRAYHIDIGQERSLWIR